MFGETNDTEDTETNNVQFDRLKEGHLPTGVEDLDKKEPKGLPQGSLVVILGNERTMSNLFLLHAASTGVETQYISTLRPEKLVQQEIDNIREDTEVNITDYFSVNDDAPSVVKSRLNRMNNGGYFMVESIDDMNFRDGAFRKTMRNVYKEVHKKNGLAFLHIQKDMDKLTEDERTLLGLADIVFYIDTDIVGSNLEHHLQIHKMRGVKRMPEAVFKLKMGDTLSIDASRDIG